MRRTYPLTVLLALVGLSACALQPPGGASPSTSASLATSSPSTSSGSASTSPSSSTSPGGDLALGPYGVGDDLKLGVTKAQIIGISLMRTGLLNGVSTDKKGYCGGDGDGWLGRTEPAEDDLTGRLFFSTTTGKLVAIYAYPDLATPEGIKLGSTLKQVKAAYSNWEYFEEEGRGYAGVSGNSKATYRIGIVDDKVSELSLDSADQDCYE